MQEISRRGGNSHVDLGRVAPSESGAFTRARVYCLLAGQHRANTGTRIFDSWVNDEQVIDSYRGKLTYMNDAP